jgi:hypothetical protein
MEWVTLILIIIVIISSIQLILHYKRRAPSIKRDTNNPQKARELMIEHLNSAREQFLLFSGVGFAKVYNDENVLEAFRNAKKKKIKIIALVENDTLDKIDGKNGLEILEKEKIIEIYKGIKPSIPLNHFRIVDDHLLYLEEQDHLGERAVHEEEKPYILYKDISSKIFHYTDTFNSLYSSCQRS